MNLHQQISLQKLHGQGKAFTDTHIHKLIQKYGFQHAEDPYWELLKKLKQLSPTELRTGQHSLRGNNGNDAEVEELAGSYHIDAANISCIIRKQDQNKKSEGQ